MSTFKHTAAVIVAAGDSTRMNSEKSKQMISVGGKEVIAHTLLKFEQCVLITSIVVVCRSTEKAEMEEICKREKISKLTKVVAGGKTRQESVRNGVLACSDKADYFAIHDGARPFVSDDVITRLIVTAFLLGACAPGVHMKDTVKIVDDQGKIVSTPSRESMVFVQTPQVFEKSLYLNALESAKNTKEQFTDDCSLVEFSGMDVYIIEGEYNNIKITTPEDIMLAESFFERVIK